MTDMDMIHDFLIVLASDDNSRLIIQSVLYWMALDTAVNCLVKLCNCNVNHCNGKNKREMMQMFFQENENSR